jgi:hypothetical protein
MKTLFLFCLSFSFLISAQAQISDLETNAKELKFTTSYHTNFWSYRTPIKIEYSDRKGIAFNPTALREQKVTFQGDSLSINFMEKDYLKSHSIIKVDALDKTPSIKILNYGSAVLNSDASSFEYTIVGKKGGTDIEINLKEAKTIRIEEGEIYQINILLSNTKEAMEPGAYAPETEKKPLIKT